MHGIFVVFRFARLKIRQRRRRLRAVFYEKYCETRGTNVKGAIKTSLAAGDFFAHASVFFDFFNCEFYIRIIFCQNNMLFCIVEMSCLC